MKGVEIMLRTATLFDESDVRAMSWSNNFYSAMANITLPLGGPYRGASKPLERDYVEVYKTDEANKIALSYENYSTSAQHVHGVDGLGDIGIKPEGNNIEKETAQEFYSMVLDSEDELEIVTLGPLTNIAELIGKKAKPDQYYLQIKNIPIIVFFVYFGI